MSMNDEPLQRLIFYEQYVWCILSKIFIKTFRDKNIISKNKSIDILIFKFSIYHFIFQLNVNS